MWWGCHRMTVTVHQKTSRRSEIQKFITGPGGRRAMWISRQGIGRE